MDGWPAVDAAMLSSSRRFLFFVSASSTASLIYVTFNTGVVRFPDSLGSVYTLYEGWVDAECGDHNYGERMSCRFDFSRCVASLDRMVRLGLRWTVYGRLPRCFRFGVSRCVATLRQRFRMTCDGELSLV